MGNQQASPQFTDKDAQILAQTSGKSEAEIRQWYSDFHAESGQTGRLNKQQFKNYYGRLSKKSNLDQLTDHIFRAFDLNQSGNSLVCLRLEILRSHFKAPSNSLSFSLRTSPPPPEAIARNSSTPSKSTTSTTISTSRRRKLRKSSI